MKEIRELKERLVELITNYPNRVIGAIIGFLAGILLVIIVKLFGFFGGLFIILCVGIGFLIGKKKGR